MGKFPSIHFKRLRALGQRKTAYRKTQSKASVKPGSRRRCIALFSASPCSQLSDSPFPVLLEDLQSVGADHNLRTPVTLRLDLGKPPQDLQLLPSRQSRPLAASLVGAPQPVSASTLPP
jgi:hypothetical protein